MTKRTAESENCWDLGIAGGLDKHKRVVFAIERNLAAGLLMISWNFGASLTRTK